MPPAVDEVERLGADQVIVSIRARSYLALGKTGGKEGVFAAAIGGGGGSESRGIDIGLIHRRVDLQGRGALAPLVVRHAANRVVGARGPAGTRGDTVAGVAVHPQRVGIGQRRDVRAFKQQRIVAGAGEVDDFDATHLEVGDGGHVDGNAGACDQQGVGAGIAIRSGDDILTGTDFPDFLDGFDGNDVLYGGAGDDSIQAGSGNDVLYGGSNSIFSMAGSVMTFCTAAPTTTPCWDTTERTRFTAALARTF